MFPYPSARDASPFGGSEACAVAGRAQHAASTPESRRIEAFLIPLSFSPRLSGRGTVRRGTFLPALHRLVDDGQQIAASLRRPNEAVCLFLGGRELGGRRFVEKR